MGNSRGTSTERRTLDYYDRLPRSVRAVVAAARFDWALRAWLLQFERGRKSAKDLVKEVRRIDAEHAARERIKVWGKDYPALRGELPTPKPKTARTRR